MHTRKNVFGANVYVCMYALLSWPGLSLQGASCVPGMLTLVPVDKPVNIVSGYSDYGPLVRVSAVRLCYCHLSFSGTLFRYLRLFKVFIKLTGIGVAGWHVAFYPLFTVRFFTTDTCILGITKFSSNHWWREWQRVWIGVAKRYTVLLLRYEVIYAHANYFHLCQVMGVANQM
jgi:hypothetical protein